MSNALSPPDLIIMGARRPNVGMLHRLVLGSVSEFVVKARRTAKSNALERSQLTPNLQFANSPLCIVPPSAFAGPDPAPL